MNGYGIMAIYKSDWDKFGGEFQDLQFVACRRQIHETVWSIDFFVFFGNCTPFSQGLVKVQIHFLRC